MLEEDFGAEGYQHKASGDGGSAFGDRDAAPPEVNTQKGDSEGHGPDEGNSPKDVGEGVLQPQANADSKGIDAGGHAEKEHGREGYGGTCRGLGLTLTAEAINNHLAPHNQQKAEGHPMVYGLDEGTRNVAHKRPSKGERALADPEDSSHKPATTHADAAVKCRGGGDDERVDAKGEGQEESFDEGHCMCIVFETRRASRRRDAHCFFVVCGRFELSTSSV